MTFFERHETVDIQYKVVTPRSMEDVLHDEVASVFKPQTVVLETDEPLDQFVAILVKFSSDGPLLTSEKVAGFFNRIESICEEADGLRVIPLTLSPCQLAREGERFACEMSAKFTNEVEK